MKEYFICFLHHIIDVLLSGRCTGQLLGDILEKEIVLPLEGITGKTQKATDKQNKLPTPQHYSVGWMLFFRAAFFLVLCEKGSPF